MTEQDDRAKELVAVLDCAEAVDSEGVWVVIKGAMTGEAVTQVYFGANFGGATEVAEILEAAARQARSRAPDVATGRTN